MRSIVIPLCLLLVTQAYAQSDTKTESMLIEYHSIGKFHTDLTPQTGAPRQGAQVPGNEGSIELFPEYQEALKDLDRCKYIIVLYHMHMSDHWKTLVQPPGCDSPLGLFATRSPNRPNSIAFSVIKLKSVEGNTLYVSGVDAFDGTPVLDIKPWFPSVDCPDTGYQPDLEKKVGLRD